MVNNAGIPVNFNGKKGFLKGYFRRKNGFKSEKKVFFPQLILHSRCFEITILKDQFILLAVRP